MRNNRVRTSRRLAGLAAIALTVVIVLGVSATAKRFPKKAPKVEWMYSTSPCIRIGVWDKGDTLSGYTVKYYITGPDTYVAKKTKTADPYYPNADVYFPSDFIHYGKNGRWYSAWAEPGTYTWKAVVNGRTVAGDRFIIRKDSTRRPNDDTTIIVP
jgi:hypothetical protein